MYRFEQFYIPDRMMGGILRYVEDGIPPGDFLQAIICNDLVEVVHRADEENRRNLPAYVAYFYNEVPLPIWRTKEKMKAWIEFNRKKREEEEKWKKVR